MRLGEVFERFIQQAPISVMFRTLLEHAFDPAEIDRLFEENATRQYTREVLFSSIVELMGAVVCGAQPSVRAAYLASLGESAASLTALYEKLKGLEPGVCRAFVLDNAGRLAPLVRQLDATLPQPVPGYRAKILDGNHLAGTEHRVPATRTTRAAALPGQSLVVLDPATMLVIDVVPCEDAHAQERSLIDQVLPGVEPGDLWIADRNFWALPFLSARRVEKGLQPSGHLADLLDRPADRLRRPIQVQDQARPQAVGGLQPVRPLGDHPRLVVDPLHRRTRLTRVKVVQDLRLPLVGGREERAEVQPQVFGLSPESPQPSRRRGAVARRVEDRLEAEAHPVQLLQLRDLLEQPLQRPLLLGCQALGITAEGPHLRAERLPLGLGQFRLGLTGQFFRSASTPSLNFLATWNRSVTPRLFFNRVAHAAGSADPMSTRWVRTCWRCSSERRSKHFWAAAVSLPRATAKIRGRAGSLRSVRSVT